MKFKKIGITVKSGLSEKDEAVTEIVSILQGLGAEVYIDEKRCKGLSCSKELKVFSSSADVDLVLVVGGDGTILRTIREMKNLCTPILSVNRGTIGFMAETSMKEAAELLPKLLNGEGVIEERSLLHIEVERDGTTVLKAHALNEAVIAQGTIARLVDLKTSVDGEPLTTYHADGLILSTPTGSTAYNLASGGPIVHPALTATILTPINPHSFSQKPIVIRGDATIEVDVQTKPNKFKDAEVVLTLDGQIYQPLQENDRVLVKMHPNTVKFLRRKQDTFYGTLREKLKWGETVEV